ncbi:hypothetical protein Poly51_10500 [Rubripirellula tenax]|uniref:Uncharacterized protein n=1 Tax=Rubripirellula tenax TaxID=2528015 RepID=A0A5C6FL27_9BACT|nr:hypothetical protein Poly51_10500 [Rubripirellula tenax]
MSITNEKLACRAISEQVEFLLASKQNFGIILTFLLASATPDLYWYNP